MGSFASEVGIHGSYRKYVFLVKGLLFEINPDGFQV